MKPRWRRVAPAELDTWRRRLAEHPCEVGGHVRHMFALSCIDGFGVDVLRVVTDGERWGLVVVHPGRVLVPCGDPDLMAAAGSPTRRWRLLVLGRGLLLRLRLLLLLRRRLHGEESGRAALPLGRAQAALLGLAVVPATGLG